MNKASHSFLEYHLSSFAPPERLSTLPEDWPEEWRKIYFKGYPRFDRIPLPEARFSGSSPMHEAMLNRRTGRDFARDRSMNLEELSRLMSALKITRGHDNVNYESRRAYPSAGGRYPIEAYVLPLRIDTLEQNVFHYHVRSHSLEKLWTFKDREFTECFPDDTWCGDAAAAIILTACHTRNVVKYGERAYRFCLFEAGQVAQNIQLLCSAERFSCCSYGGFVDEVVMRLIDVNPQEELVMHVMFVGLPQSTDQTRSSS